MSTVVAFIIGLLIVVFVAVLMLFATWLFVNKLRRGKSPTKSFFKWLLDLYDITLGLG
ncbi:hypothetical protein [Arenimonas sp.]|uniref:hypothetical protein n=1 Tax=Arenimonas sp. TaxID=1872635 RepID=UPI002E33E6D6|nr:hypothetical protein [Arenimonas sp.]HEX4854767.1 hypothetical protein [Arenimonas sp.]